jgi:hypothetical protein
LSRSDADIAVEIAPAGLRFVERDRTEPRLPVEAANLAPSCRDEDGRVDAEPHEFVDTDDPDRVGKLNAGWLRLADEHGLFNNDREFLLEVDYAEDGDDWPELAWIRVRIQEGWSIAEGTVPALGSLGGPEFTALSVDERALMRTTLWGNGSVSSLVIVQPATASPIRRWAEYIAEDPQHPSTAQAAARAWLDEPRSPRGLTIHRS